MMPTPGAVAILFFCMFLSACSSARNRVDGVIVDADHNDAPIPAAIIVLTRMREVGTPMYASERCDDQELTYSDSEGRFHFEPWSAPHGSLWDYLLPSDYRVDLTIYKRGFVPDSDAIHVRDGFRGTVRLRRFDAPADQQIARILRVTSVASCNNAHREAARPLLDALNADAEAIPVTPDQQQLVRGRQFKQWLYLNLAPLWGWEPTQPPASAVVGSAPPSPQSSATQH